MTYFIGRSNDEQRLKDALADGARCITVTGPPGVGKTSLLGAVFGIGFEGTLLRFDAGAFQSFDSLKEALRLRLGANTTTPLVEALDTRPLCLVIDHAETMRDADFSAGLGEWLANTAELQLVCASRERLSLHGERLLTVEPLSTTDALRLFERRIAALGVMPVDEARVRLLLAQLGGLPLAIELAAARCRMVPIDTLIQRCEESSAVLGAALEASIARSIALLNGESASLLRMLSLFEGPITIAAIESVWPESPWDLVQTLRDSNLVHSTPSGALELLPPIRSSVYGELKKREESRVLAERHRAWAEGETRRALAALSGENWRQGYEALGLLRAEVEGALSRVSGADERARLVGHLDEIRPYFGAGLELAREMEMLIDDARLDDETRGELALRRAHLAFSHGDLDSASAFHSHAITTFAPLEKRPSALCLRLDLRIARGDCDVLEELEVAAAEAADLGDRESESRFRATFIELSRMFGRDADARRHGERALLLAGGGIPTSRAPILAGLGFSQSESGRPEEAARYADEGLAALDEVSPLPSRTRSALLIIRGRAAHFHGDYTVAKAAYVEAAKGPDPFMSASAGAVIATLHIEKAEFIEARDRLRAVAGIVSQHQPVYGAVFVALLASVEARLSLVERARALFDDIPETLMPPFAGAILELCNHVILHAEGHPVDSPAECRPHAMWIEHRAARSVLQSQLRGDTVGGLRVKTLHFGAKGDWFEANGERVALGRRPIMRRIALAFVERRALKHEELLACGWGEEKMLKRSAMRRLEVMVSRMRALGMGDAIETVDGGYRLHPDCHVSVDEP